MKYRVTYTVEDAEVCLTVVGTSIADAVDVAYSRLQTLFNINHTEYELIRTELVRAGAK